MVLCRGLLIAWGLAVLVLFYFIFFLLRIRNLPLTTLRIPNGCGERELFASYEDLDQRTQKPAQGLLDVRVLVLESPSVLGANHTPFA